MAAGSATGAVDSSIIGLISQAENTTVRFYGMLSMGELALLRCTLARFFQDKHVKVSLFLSEGIQLSSGKLVIPSCINDQVGIVRTYDADGKLEGEERLQAASQKVCNRTRQHNWLVQQQNSVCRSNQQGCAVLTSMSIQVLVSMASLLAKQGYGLLSAYSLH
eukprot:GHRR01035452.1.p1 GENE.GHRR01035452.1~~GHRR01035452.1.p1  ORF type:complete len:180 (+),score=54.15 GHRR01035452.1:52-540(+)